MLRRILCTVIFIVVLDVIPHRISSTPLMRVLRSPSTTPESHISNFLHQHRTDSRADKPNEHPANDTSDPLHHIHTTTTTTEAPITQTELLTNVLHTVLHGIRERFPGLIDSINAISAPKAPPPEPTHHHKRRITHHLHHAAQDRSDNATSVEDTTEIEELSIEDSVEDSGDPGPSNSVPSLLPSSLIKVVLEASSSSAARGSASASAGSVASLSGSSSSSSSGGGGGNNGRSNDEDENQGSGSGNFLVAKIQHKARLLSSLVFAPLRSVFGFVQRSIGAASSTSSGLGSLPGSSPTEPEQQPQHHHHNHEAHDHHEKHHNDEHHHHGDHASNHHQAENVTSADGIAHLVGGDDAKENLHRLAFRNAFYKYTNLMTKGTFNDTNPKTEDQDYRLSMASSDDGTGPLRVVLDNGGLDNDGTDNPNEIDPLQD